MLETHHKYMRLAIKEAIKANGKEVPVGAVLVDKNKKVLAKNYNRVITKCDPTAHAEIGVLRMAALKLKNYRLLGTTLYVTIEPCAMCMCAIIHARVSTLVFGATDTKWGACGSLYNFACDGLLNHNVKVIRGIYANECGIIMRNFFSCKRNKAK